MKNPLKNIILLFFLFFTTRIESTLENWKKLVLSNSFDNVSISFVQYKNNGSWTVQWMVKNDSLNHIEPILVSRNYICKNNNTQQIGSVTLGTFLAGSHQESILKDHDICPNSQIETVEIETEIYLLTDFLNKKTSLLE